MIYVNLGQIIFLIFIYNGEWATKTPKIDQLILELVDIARKLLLFYQTRETVQMFERKGRRDRSILAGRK